MWREKSFITIFGEYNLPHKTPARDRRVRGERVGERSSVEREKLQKLTCRHLLHQWRSSGKTPETTSLHPICPSLLECKLQKDRDCHFVSFCIPESNTVPDTWWACSTILLNEWFKERGKCNLRSVFSSGTRIVWPCRNSSLPLTTWVAYCFKRGRRRLQGGWCWNS